MAFTPIPFSAFVPHLGASLVVPATLQQPPAPAQVLGDSLLRGASLFLFLAICFSLGPGFSRPFSCLFKHPGQGTSIPHAMQLHQKIKKQNKQQNQGSHLHTGRGKQESTLYRVLPAGGAAVGLMCVHLTRPSPLPTQRGLGGPSTEEGAEVSKG